MKKILLYIILFSKNLLQQIDSKRKRMLSIGWIIAGMILIPFLLALILYPIFEKTKGFILFLPLIILLLDIDKAVTRVKHSRDIKILHHFNFTAIQYVIAKDLSKFYSRIVSIYIFFLSLYSIQVINSLTIQPLLEFIFFILFLLIGYWLRVYSIIFMSLFYNVYIISLMNYLLLGIVSLSIFLEIKYNIFGSMYVENLITINSVSTVIYSGIILVLITFFKRYHNLSVKFFYDSHPKMNIFIKSNKRKSVISKSKVLYELLLIARNPPVGIGVVLLILVLTFGLLGVIIYVIENSLSFNSNGSSLLFLSLILPGIISSYIIQPFVSFDLDGNIMRMNKNNAAFIINKITVKEIISIIINLSLLAIYMLVIFIFLENAFTLRGLIMVLFSYIIISISTVTSTIAFPFFKWNYFYEIPSTLSKILLAIFLSSTLFLGSVGSQANYFISIIVIVSQLTIIIFLLIINRVLWRVTINKNFFSIRILKE